MLNCVESGILRKRVTSSEISGFILKVCRKLLSCCSEVETNGGTFHRTRFVCLKAEFSPIKSSLKHRWKHCVTLLLHWNKHFFLHCGRTYVSFRAAQDKDVTISPAE